MKKSKAANAAANGAGTPSAATPPAAAAAPATPPPAAVGVVDESKLSVAEKIKLRKAQGVNPPAVGVATTTAPADQAPPATQVQAPAEGAGAPEAASASSTTTPPPETAAETAARRGRPPGAKNKPKNGETAAGASAESSFTGENSPVADLMGTLGVAAAELRTHGVGVEIKTTF